MRLVLIRHAEADCMIRQVFGVPIGCTGLTDEGKRQAERLRQRLEASGELSAALFLSSPLPRAVETADIIESAIQTPERRVDRTSQRCAQARATA
jgi:probable phosphoglycerate mutase